MLFFYRFLSKLNRISQKVCIILIFFGIAYPLPGWCAEQILKKEETHSFSSGRKVVRILTIDGGGVRGIIPATLLEGIEERLEANSGEKVSLAQYFDIMSGTSTGGIIVLGLNAGMSAEDLAQLYFKNGETIFPTAGMFNKGLTGPKYDAAPLETLLEEKLGNKWLKDALSHVIIPADDLGQKLGYLFDSHEAKMKSHNFKMKDVARATSAAPTYFEAATIQDEKGYSHIYLDGGLYANDPTFEAIQAAEKNFPGCDLFIVSLGTGEAPRKFGDLSLVKGGKLAWASEIAGVLMDRAQDKHLNVLKGIQSLMAQQGRKVKYHRIQVFVDASIIGLDDTKSIPKLREAGKYLLNPLNPERKYEEIMQIVDELEKYQQTLEYLC